MRRDLRRRWPAAAAALIVTWLVAAPVRAQSCGGPYEGSVAITPTPTTTLRPNFYGPYGDYFLEIPGTSPVNANPNDPTANGFVQLCGLFGLTGTASSISQINARDGFSTTFYCDQRKAPPFQPCQAVVIRAAPVAASFQGQIPLNAAHHEGTWSYTFYADGLGLLGDNLYGVPLTAPVSTSPADICTLLNLPPETLVGCSDPVNGILIFHVCGHAVQALCIAPGRALLIRPPAAVTATMPIP